MARKGIIESKKYDNIRESWNGKAQDRIRYSKNTWIEFAVSTVRGSSIFSLIYKITVFVRRITFISTLLAILKVVFIAISTSAFFVFVVAGALIALPFLAIAAIFALVHTVVTFGYYNSLFEKLLIKRNLYVFFPSKAEGLYDGSYFADTVAKAAKDGLAIIVSPYYFLTRGVGGRGFFMTCRREAENLYIIRRRYFFIFKRKILNKTKSETILIY